MFMARRMAREEGQWTAFRAFAAQGAFTTDEIAAMHDTALRVLERLGIRILLDEARALFRAAGSQPRRDQRHQLIRPRSHSSAA
mgnify:CR=1 FL=1